MQCPEENENGKAVGPDNIPAEAWKCLGNIGAQLLKVWFNNIIESGKMPEEWRNSVMIPIYKSKGDIQDGINYRGIKLAIRALSLVLHS